MSEAIPVQPREIVDLMYRIARVDGLDHGNADPVSYTHLTLPTKRIV